MIISDLFRSYWNLRNLGYEHLMVNHKKEFVAKEPYVFDNNNDLEFIYPLE